ncbi:MAG TPA: hypothetical protein VK403_11580 [Allosphingosinicella sp.]|nr:hypothetical protein [Allosphingosinicella sp.]
MTRLLLPLLLFLAAETAALACSCIMPPADPAQRRAHVREAARGALALVEVELLVPYDRRRGRGERLRVRRTLAGRAPAAFEVERNHVPSSASCDVEFQRGGRTLVLLYAPRARGRAAMPRYRVSASCTGLMLADPAFRTLLVAEIRSRR